MFACIIDVGPLFEINKLSDKQENTKYECNVNFHERIGKYRINLTECK